MYDPKRVVHGPPLGLGCPPRPSMAVGSKIASMFVLKLIEIWPLF